MRIALLHYSAPPVIGGVEAVIARHAKLMVNAGHVVKIIAGRGEIFDRRIQFAPISLIDSRNSTVLDVKAELDAGQITTKFQRLVKEIESRLLDVLASVDLVFAHNVCSLHKNLALTAALHEISQRNGSPKLVLWHHDIAWTSARYKGELHDGYPWDLLTKAWGHRIVTISQQRQREISQLTGLPPEHIQIIPNGIDHNELLGLGSVARAIAEKLNLVQANPLLLLPVRITQRKNIELALRVLAKLRQTLPKSALVITGPVGAHNPANVAYFESLKALKREMALDGAVYFLAEEWPHRLADEAIADLFRLSDALFLPSWEEGFGIPIIEAALLGKQIFASNIASLKELAGEDAIYFPPDGEPTEIAKLIAGALQGSAIHRQRVRIRQNFSWAAIYANRIAPLIVAVNGAA